MRYQHGRRAVVAGLQDAAAPGPGKGLREARRIAVVRTDRLGDLVLTLPMLEALRLHLPAADLHLICREYAAPAAAGLACVDQIHLVDREPGGLRGLLARQRFDAVFLPQARPNEAWAAFRAGVPLRVGSGYRWYSFLYNHRVYDHRSNGRFHEAEYNTRLVAAVIGSAVETRLQRPAVDPAAAGRVNRLLADRGIPPGARLVVIHPGTGGSTREWPARRFGELASRLVAFKAFETVITGTRGEEVVCSAALQACPAAVSLCGEISLPEMMALLERAALLVANSTGVLHLAAALGTPVVGLYPNASSLGPRRWRPWTTHAAVVTPPITGADPDDMSAIPVEAVLEAAKALL